MSVHVRAAAPPDRDGILSLVPRLRAFGPPSLRPLEALDAAERATLDRALASLSDDALLLVVEVDGELAGVAYAELATDYFTRERHAHLGILIVSESAEGKGVGQALLKAVEAWACARGTRFVTLNVFAGNARALRVYERAGYAPDTIRYVKELESGD